MSNIQNYLSPPLAVVSGGTGTTTAFTLGSVIFAGDSGVYNQNNANFFWDNTNNRLGLGTTGPGQTLSVTGTAQATAVRATGPQTAGTGPGIELQYITGNDYGTVDTYDRTGAVYKALQLDGLIIRFAASGIEKMRMDASGNFGIGTTVPASPLSVVGGIRLGDSATIAGIANALTVRRAAGDSVVYFNMVDELTVTQTIASGGAGKRADLVFSNDASGNYIFNTGNVGIRTTAPDTTLHINGGLKLGDSTTAGATPNALLVRRTAGDSVIYFQMIDESSVTHTIASGGAGRRPDLVFSNDASGSYIFNTGNVGIGTTTPSRLLHVEGRYQLGGTAIATTDWALTSGWGANAAISAVTGTDSRGTVTVTTSALDTPSANPVITLTFKNGTWTTTPFVMANMDHGSTGPSTVPVTCNATVTTLVISYRGTPTATSALTYKFNYLVVG